MEKPERHSLRRKEDEIKQIPPDGIIIAIKKKKVGWGRLGKMLYC